MPLPDFKLPRLFSAVASRLPEAPAAIAFASALNLAQRLGKLPGDWDFLEGRTVRLEIEDLGAGISFTRAGERFLSVSGPAEVRFAASAADYLKIALREEDPDTLFFSRRLRMEGDTDLGLLVKNTLDAVDWDALKAKLLGRHG